jgi:hypothetical protein
VADYSLGCIVGNPAVKRIGGIGIMTTAKAKAGYMAVGALLTILVLLPLLKQAKREQEWGLLLTPEEVKGACGKPQADDVYTLTYVDGDLRTELRFMGANHKIFLNHVKWTSSKGGSGDIYKVSKDLISDHVKRGWLPACLERAAE